MCCFDVKKRWLNCDKHIQNLDGFLWKYGTQKVSSRFWYIDTWCSPKLQLSKDEGIITSFFKTRNIWSSWSASYQTFPKILGFSVSPLNHRWSTMNPPCNQLASKALPRPHRQRFVLELPPGADDEAYKGKKCHPEVKTRIICWWSGDLTIKNAGCLWLRNDDFSWRFLMGISNEFQTWRALKHPKNTRAN
jgi:hypothetical protein